MVLTLCKVKQKRHYNMPGLENQDQAKQNEREDITLGKLDLFLSRHILARFLPENSNCEQLATWNCSRRNTRCTKKKARGQRLMWWLSSPQDPTTLCCFMSSQQLTGMSTRARANYWTNLQHLCAQSTCFWPQTERETSISIYRQSTKSWFKAGLLSDHWENAPRHPEDCQNQRNMRSSVSFKNSLLSDYFHCKDPLLEFCEAYHFWPPLYYLCTLS